MAWLGLDASRWGTLSLRAQVALVVAGLSFLPNVLLTLTLFIPTYNRITGVPAVQWWPLLAWMTVTALLSAGIGYLLSRQLLLPLTRLNAQLALLRRSPDWLSLARLKRTSNDPKEISQLKASFNELLVQISTEQSRRRSFMATLMHDLKTPLIAANHLLSVIRDSDALPPGERAAMASSILGENRQLIELVQKLVDAHKFEQEDIALSRNQIKLETLVESVVDRVSPLARERGVDIEVHGSAVAQVDVRELERALYNLVSNAVRYARSLISIELFPGLIRLSDDGPGLPAPLSALAQPFTAQPVELAGKEYTAGTGGLGLFIARRILEAHGGRLALETSGDTGTVFLIYLGQA